MGGKRWKRRIKDPEKKPGTALCGACLQETEKKWPGNEKEKSQRENKVGKRLQGADPQRGVNKVKKGERGGTNTRAIQEKEKIGCKGKTGNNFDRHGGQRALPRVHGKGKGETRSGEKAQSNRGEKEEGGEGVVGERAITTTGKQKTTTGGIK